MYPGCGTLRYTGLCILTTSIPLYLLLGAGCEVHELRYAGLGTMTNRISDVQAIGSWIRYLGLGTLAKSLVDEQS